MPNTDDALAALTTAAAGLLVPSESDYPFDEFWWAGCGPLTPDTLVAALGLPPDTPVETRTLDAFFARLTTADEWMDDGQRAQAARFGQLRDLIAARLTDVVVYRVGQIQITVIIAGADTSGTTIGLRTTLIET